MIYQKLTFSAPFREVDCTLKCNILLDFNHFTGIMMLIEPAKAMRKHLKLAGLFLGNRIK